MLSLVIGIFEVDLSLLVNFAYAINNLPEAESFCDLHRVDYELQKR